MSEENTVDPEVETSTPPPVLVLPGHIFFVERVELPTTLEGAELDDFAELSLEGISPFPVEQLFWGFIHSEPSASILLYAAYKERVKALGYTELESYLWVLPDFAASSGAYFPEDVTLCLESEQGCSSVYLSKGESLPEKVLSTAPNSKAPPQTSSSKSLRVHLESVEVSEQGLPTFHFVSAERADENFEGKWKALSPGQSQLWRADIRGSEFKKNERNKRKMGSWIARATGYAALFAVFLIFLEGLLFLGGLWMNAQSATIAEQAPEVRRVEDKQSLMNKLDQVAQNELRPVAILNALNNPRPQGIYFTSTQTDGLNRITIDGIANTITELNNYTKALLNSGNFEMQEDPKTLTRGGKTTFTATLDYIHKENTTETAEDVGT
ncbi:MAG: hypothetical protein ACPGSB_03885 [Opitutales bacterium]